MPSTLLACCALLFLTAPPAAEAGRGPAPVVLVTDPSWKGVPAALAGWDSPRFDDAAWPAAAVIPGSAENGAHYTVPNLFGRATAASWVWAGGGEECCLRRAFDAPQGFRRAEMLFAADDDAEVYLNGRRLPGYDTGLISWGHRGGARLLDLVPYLDEGRNVLAVRVRNHGGPKGFAAEVRVDGAPFVARPPAQAAPPPPKLLKEFDALARRLDADAFAAREEASAGLLALVRRHGEALRAKVDALARSDSAEVRWRAERLRRELPEPFPELRDRAEVDWRLAFLRLSLDDVRAGLLRHEGSLAVTPRLLLPLRALAAADEPAACALLARLLDGGPDYVAERVVECVGFLELAPLRGALADVLRRRPGTPAGAAAASALGRLGGREELAALEAAAGCGHGPTERAARHALGLLRR